MNSKILLLVLSLNILIMTACVKQGEPLNKHEGPTQTVINQEESNSKLEAQFEAWDLQSLHSKISQNKQVDEKVFEQLANWVLNKDTLQQLQIVHRPKWAQALSLLNWHIVASKNLSIDARKKWLQQYEAATLFNCQNISDTCPNLKWFSKDPQSAEILCEIAQSKTDVREYYLVMYAAYDISTIGRSQNFMDLYQKRSAEYISVLEKSSEAKDKELLSRHRKSFSILRQSREEKVSFNDFKNDLEVYRKQVRDLQAEVKSRFAKAWTLLSLQDVPNINAAAAFHAYFTDKLSVTDMDKYYETEKIPDEDLKNSLSSYLRIQFAKALLESNQLFAQSIDEKEFDGEIFFEKILFNTNSIGNKWRIFISKSDRANEAIQTARVFTPGTKQALSNILSRIRYNVKIYSLYPHMLAAAYYVAKYSIVKTFSFFFFKFTLPADDLVRGLMFPNDYYAATWFDYGTLVGAEDKIPLKKLEMIDSFEMALRSGLFDEMKIDTSDFLNRIFKSAFNIYTTSRGNIEPQMGLDFINATFDSSYNASTPWKNFMRQCDQITNNKPVELELPINEISMSPTLGQSKYKVSTCTMAFSGNIPNFHGLCPIMEITKRGVETIRAGVKPVLLYANLILKVYKNYLKTKNLSAEETKTQLETATSQVKALRKSADRYLETYAEKAISFTKCLPRFVSYETEHKLNIVDDMDLWIRDFYRKIKTQSAAVVQKRLRAEVSQSGYNSLIEITDQKFKFTRFDILMKLAEFSNKREKGLKYVVPQSFSEPEITTSPSENYVETIDLNLNEDQFTQKMLVRIFGDNRTEGWLIWFSKYYYAYNPAQEWQEGMAVLHRLDSKKYNLDLVLDAANSNYKLANLTERQLKTLSKLNRSSIIDEDDNIRLENFFLNKLTQKPIGIYDAVNSYLAKDILGDYDAPPNGNDNDLGIKRNSEINIPYYIMPPLKEAREYALFAASRPQPIFELSNRNAEIYKNYYRIQVEQMKKTYKNFRQSVDTITTPAQIRIRSDKVIDIPKISSEESYSFDAQMENFNKLTSNFYVKEPSLSETQIQAVQAAFQIQDTPVDALDTQPLTSSAALSVRGE